MIITSEDVTLTVQGTDKPARALITRPKQEGDNNNNNARKYPGIVMFSDIFQLTGPQLRVSRRLAGYGFVVATPEIYHRIEPAGTAIPFDDAGRTRGQNDAKATSVAEFDATARAALDWLAKSPHVKANSLGAMGFCIGGHLAFRAALQPDVRATAAFYPTGVHDGKLGSDDDAKTLHRLHEIKGELHLVFGSRDPHVPEAALKVIEEAIQASGIGTRTTTSLYAAEHAFMRDEGPRYDAEATDEAWLEAVRFLRRVLPH